MPWWLPRGCAGVSACRMRVTGDCTHSGYSVCVCFWLQPAAGLWLPGAGICMQPLLGRQWVHPGLLLWAVSAAVYCVLCHRHRCACV